MVARLYTPDHGVYMAETCDCHGDASKHPSHTIRTFARSASSVVSGRVTNSTAKALLRYCQDHSCTQSEALRAALAMLSSASGPNEDPAAAIAALLKTLGLPDTATSEEVMAAVKNLLGSATHAPAGADPSAQAADAPPVALSVVERAQLSKITDPGARAKFVALRAERHANRTPRQIKKGTP